MGRDQEASVAKFSRWDIEHLAHKLSALCVAHSQDPAPDPMTGVIIREAPGRAERRRENSPPISRNVIVVEPWGILFDPLLVNPFHVAIAQ